MKVPVEFDDIRPFEPEELPEVLERLCENKQFQAVMTHIMPDVPFSAIAEKMRSCKTNLDFQKNIAYSFITQLMQKASKGYEMDSSEIDLNGRYTFMSNHRDIVLDSALLNFMLLKAGCETTGEIAIGDNLLSLDWVKDVVRLNKAFIVRRSLQPRERLAASQQLSDYMHFVITKKHDNIWIAQSEGRAKDSNDRTQTALLKMIAKGGEGSLTERVREMNIVPLSISYEYDPCDYLKAKEFQQKRDTENFKKAPMDDVLSMQVGIMGYKGRIHYHCAPCINDYLKGLDDDMPKTELFGNIASHIDREIHRNYRLYPINYVAADILRGNGNYSDRYTDAEKKTSELYLHAQLAKIDLENKDEDFLMERLLTMYANPAINHFAACDND